MGFRVCRKCGEDKELSEYQMVKAKLKSGYIKIRIPHICKQCNRERQYEWRKEKYKNDPEYRKKAIAMSSKINKKRRKNDPEYAEFIRKQNAEWGKNNREKVNEKQRKYRERKPRTEEEIQKRRAYGQNQRDTLDDVYVKRVIVQSSANIKREEITPELIEVYREKLIINRKIKNHEQTIKA